MLCHIPTWEAVLLLVVLKCVSFRRLLRWFRIIITIRFILDSTGSISSKGLLNFSSFLEVVDLWIELPIGSYETSPIVNGTCYCNDTSLRTPHFEQYETTRNVSWSDFLVRGPLLPCQPCRRSSLEHIDFNIWTCCSNFILFVISIKIH